MEKSTKINIGVGVGILMLVAVFFIHHWGSAPPNPVGSDTDSKTLFGSGDGSGCAVPKLKTFNIKPDNATTIATNATVTYEVRLNKYRTR